jgi:ankyrin repeat protein
MKRIIALLFVLVVYISSAGFAQVKEFHRYANAGDTSKLTKFLKEHPNFIKKRKYDGIEAIVYAIQKNNVQVARILLDAGVDPNATSRDGWYTPFMNAVNWANPEMVKLFLAKGGDVNYVHRRKVFVKQKNEEVESITPVLMWVVRNNDPEILKLFLEKGADVHLGAERNMSCLRYLWKDPLKKLKLLLEYGIDINYRGHDNTTILMKYCGMKMTKATKKEIAENQELIKFLLANGIDIEAKDDLDWTALHHAVWYNNIYALKLLLKAGADPKVRSPILSSPLRLANKIERTEMIPLLEKAAKFSLK